MHVLTHTHLCAAHTTRTHAHDPTHQQHFVFFRIKTSHSNLRNSGQAHLRGFRRRTNKTIVGIDKVFASFYDELLHSLPNISRSDDT
jgi:hypothetical protein